MAPHTSFRQGQPVFIQLKDGTNFTDVFVEKRSQFIVLRKAGRVRIEAIRAVSVAR